MKLFVAILGLVFVLMVVEQTQACEGCSGKVVKAAAHGVLRVVSLPVRILKHRHEAVQEHTACTPEACAPATCSPVQKIPTLPEACKPATCAPASCASCGQEETHTKRTPVRKVLRFLCPCRK